MNRTHMLVRHVLSAVAGALVASAVVVISDEVGSAEEAAARKPTRTVVEERVERIVAVPDSSVLHNARRLEELKRQIDEVALELEARARPGPENAGPPESIEERQAELRASWEDGLAAHDASPIDDDWAYEFERLFEEVLDAVRSDTLRPLSVDCRTSSCTARIEFDTFRNAQNELSRVLHQDNRAACTTRIVLPEPEDPDVPYVATVLYRCG